MSRRQGLLLLLIAFASAGGHPARGEQPATEGRPKPAEEARAARTDRYGDPLPEDALARLGTLRLRRGDYVCGVAFSPDGKILAAGDATNAVCFWSPATGREIRLLEGHKDSVNAVAFSPDGKTLASGSHDRTVRLWDPASGKELRHFEGEFAFYSVTFAPDGKLLAAADDRGQVHLWDTATGKGLRQFQGYSCMGQPLAFSPDGKSLFSPGGERALLMWEVSSGKELRRFRGHEHQTVSDAIFVNYETLRIRATPARC